MLSIFGRRKCLYFFIFWMYCTACMILVTLWVLRHFNGVHLFVIRYVCLCAKSIESCLTLFGLMDCSPPGSSVHGILQAGILEWVAMPLSSPEQWSKLCPLHWQHGGLTTWPRGKSCLRISYSIYWIFDCPGDPVVKNLPEGAAVSIPGSVRLFREDKGNPLQYSCLENLMDIGAWQATVIAQSPKWYHSKGAEISFCIWEKQYTSGYLAEISPV